MFLSIVFISLITTPQTILTAQRQGQAKQSADKQRQASGLHLALDQPQAASLWSFVRRNKALRLTTKQAKTGCQSRRPCSASPPCLDACQPPRTSRARSSCQLCHVSTSATVPHHHQSRSSESALAWPPVGRKAIWLRHPGLQVWTPALRGHGSTLLSAARRATTRLLSTIRVSRTDGEP